MPDNPTAYLVLASQRSGSTLFGGIAAGNRRRRGTAGVLPVSARDVDVPAAAGVVRRCDRRVDPAAARSAGGGQARYCARRDLAGLHPHGRADAQRGVGRQADVESGATAAAARRGSAESFGRRPARGDPRRRGVRSGAGASIGPTWCPRRCRSGARFRPGSGGVVRTRSAMRVRSITPVPSHMS